MLPLTVKTVPAVGVGQAKALAYLVVPALDVGHIHVVSGRANVLVLLLCENVKGHEMDLSVTVLACLRSGHLHDLAGAGLK